MKENIQEQMKELFGASCYAYCISFLFGQKRDIKDLTKDVLEGWFRGYIDNDGFVSKPLKYIEMLCGTKYRDITKPEVKSLLELPDGFSIVEYRNGNKQHFVVANKLGIVFDPSGDSNTVKYGKPFTYRKFIE